MANNRIWLVHRPTGKAVCLGKVYSHGTLTPDYAPYAAEDLGKRLHELFTEVEATYELMPNHMLDYALVAESIMPPEVAPHVVDFRDCEKVPGENLIWIKPK